MAEHHDIMVFSFDVASPRITAHDIHGVDCRCSADPGAQYTNVNASSGMFILNWRMPIPYFPYYGRAGQAEYK